MNNKILIFIIYIFLILNFKSQIMADECVSGNCVNGQGTYKHANGEYVGEFKDGKANGQGTATSADGQVKYVGEFKDDNFHGKGKLTYKKGSIYEGEFKNDIINGKGELILTNGKVYQGDWNLNLLNNNKLIYQNGNIFEGFCIFKNNRWFRNGYGVLTTSTKIYYGHWKDDKPLGIMKVKDKRGGYGYINDPGYIDECILDNNLNCIELIDRKRLYTGSRR